MTRFLCNYVTDAFVTYKSYNYGSSSGDKVSFIIMHTTTYRTGGSRTIHLANLRKVKAKLEVLVGF
jgi:hypothetical protein